MGGGCSRRQILKLGATLVPVNAMNRISNVFRLNNENSNPMVSETYPSHPAGMAHEVVTVSHFDLKRLRELVDARPALARAAWDWGFGDWETALGAASHTGNRPIAEYLIEKGARPSLFSAAMFGQLEVVKAFVQSQPGVQHIAGPHSISLLAHAKAGGQMSRAVYDYLHSLGDADAAPEVPLSADLRERILGTYIFGSNPTQSIAITMEHNPFLNLDQLTWTRKGTTGRPLYHVGAFVFYPAGANHVRIAFAEEQDAVRMTVADGNLVLTARRAQKQ